MRRRQGGQVLVLFALMSTVLLGFLGLAIDGGEAAAQQQLVRNAADGAALDAFYVVKTGGSLAAATTAAGKVVSEDGLPATDLTMTYLDSGGLVTSLPAAVATAQATVTDVRATFFLSLLGLRSERVSAIAGASSAANSNGSVCGLCLLTGGSNAYDAGSSTVTTITGAPMISDGTVRPNLVLGSHASLTAPSITIAGGTPNSISGSATVSPAPVVGSPVADPFSGIAAPSIAGSPVAYTAPAGSSTISAGVYSSISVPAGASLTLSPGNYALTGPLNISGAVTGSGVLLYLACSTYPADCTGGVPQANITVNSGGSLTVAAPTTGTYGGLAVFADRADTATNGASGATLSVTGTWYTAAMPFRDGGSTSVLSATQMVMPSIHLASSDQLQVSYNSSAAYGSGGIELSQ